MNTIGIDRNLDRARIRKLLAIGLFASILTGIGDFLLGYAESTAAGSFAASVMASAPNLSDGQMIAGSLLGFFGIFLEGLACFGIYRLMADAAPQYAHLYRGSALTTPSFSTGCCMPICRCSVWREPSTWTRRIIKSGST